MVYDLITDPEYQGRGLGKEVLRRLVDKCSQEGIRDIQLFCAQGKKHSMKRGGLPCVKRNPREWNIPETRIAILRKTSQDDNIELAQDVVEWSLKRMSHRASGVNME